MLSASESHDTRNRQLSLELILSVLDHTGPVFRYDENTVREESRISYLIRFFRNYERFIHHGLREHLVTALMVNGTSSHPKVFRLVIKIFLHILSYFRDYMKVFHFFLIFFCNSNIVNIIGRGGGFYN